MSSKKANNAREGSAVDVSDSSDLESVAVQSVEDEFQIFGKQ